MGISQDLECKKNESLGSAWEHSLSLIWVSVKIFCVELGLNKMVSPANSKDEWVYKDEWVSRLRKMSRPPTKEELEDLPFDPFRRGA